MPDDKERVGTAILVYDTASGRESWGIRALDLQTVPENVRIALRVVMESEPRKIPVQTGVFRGTGVTLLATALRERYLRGEISVSQATREDLGYYWLLIPYDIEEPVLRIDTAQSSFLVDVEENGRIHWIDLLPEDIAAAERSAK